MTFHDFLFSYFKENNFINFPTVFSSLYGDLHMYLGLQIWTQIIHYSAFSAAKAM